MRSENPWRAALRYQGWIWLALALVYFVFDQGRQPDPQYADLLLRSAVWALTGAAVTWVVGLVWARLNMQRLMARLGGAVGLSAVASFIWMVIFVGADHPSEEPRRTPCAS